jgi:hypothetical protein
LSPDAKAYSDLAITPVIDAEGEELELFALNDSARAVVEKARHQADRRRHAQAAPTLWWRHCQIWQEKARGLLPTR